LCKVSYRSVKGLRCGGGTIIACSHRKAESSITLHCTAVHAVIDEKVFLFFLKQMGYKEKELVGTLERCEGSTGELKTAKRDDYNYYAGLGATSR
jgi:hypothetical protein